VKLDGFWAKIFTFTICSHIDLGVKMIVIDSIVIIIDHFAGHTTTRIFQYPARMLEGIASISPTTRTGLSALTLTETA